MTRGSFAIWSAVPTEVRLLLFFRNGRQGDYCFLVSLFQRDSSQFLEKEYMGLNAVKGLIQHLKRFAYISESKGTCNHQSSKVNFHFLK